MLSALIPSILSYPAMPLAEQLVHQRYVHPGPLVLGTAPLKSPTPTADRDRTVSRRSEPSSRTSLMGRYGICMAELALEGGSEDIIFWQSRARLRAGLSSGSWEPGIGPDGRAAPGIGRMARTMLSMALSVSGALSKMTLG